jgi:hypothetical protein
MFGTATVGPRLGVNWLVAIYLIAGGIVAATHDYWSTCTRSRRSSRPFSQLCSGR